MKKARIEVIPEFPDWKLTIYVYNKEIGSGYFASLAEALISLTTSYPKYTTSRIRSTAIPNTTHR